jgi:hypothetical protein
VCIQRLEGVVAGNGERAAEHALVAVQEVTIIDHSGASGRRSWDQYFCCPGMTVKGSFPLTLD